MADPKLTLLSTTILLLLTVFSAVMLFIQMKVALLYLFGLHKPSGDVFCFGGGEEEGTFVQDGNRNSSEHRFCTATAFGELLEANPQLILLEPDYLVGVHLKQKSALLSFESAWKRHWADRGWLSSGDKEKMVKKYAEALADWKDLQWRFDLPAEGFGSSTRSLTVGLISWPKTSVEDLFKSLKLTGFYLFEEVSGVVHHGNSSNVPQPLHYFLVNKDSYLLSGDNQGQANFTDFQPLLLLHIVVLHRVAEFIWVGGVSAETGQKLQQKLTSATSVNSSQLLPLHFGAEYEQIYDPFTGVASSADGHFWVSVPDDIGHLLSQLPTARYLYCPPERGVAWFATTGRQPNEPYERISLLAYRQMKALARHLRMEVWIACGTLLGWYRQCTVTPYTGDTDFASWAKYVQNKSTSNFNAETTLQEALEELESQLGLYRRFGEPTATLEYTFLYAVQERVDLFFAYSNGSHLMTPLHEPISGRYTYNVYPPFRLCSVALLGVKLLAPCDPERLITVEYGATWRQPITPYNYLSGPLNTLPLRAYNFSEGEQQQQQPQQVKYSGLPPPPKHWEPKALEVFLQNLTAKLEGYF